MHRFTPRRAMVVSFGLVSALSSGSGAQGGSSVVALGAPPYQSTEQWADGRAGTWRVTFTAWALSCTKCLSESHNSADPVAPVCSPGS
jgi:hypothetical protein